MPDRVLIIDDGENIRQMLRLTLETAAYEVGEAGDGMEAFAILGGDQAWNVILLDQRLPIMEGTEVLRRIKCWPPGSGGDDDCV
jgi:CheY-like chemotaxis protein